MPNPNPMQTKTNRALGQAFKVLKKTWPGVSLCGPSMKVPYRSIWAKCFLPCLGLALGLLPALPEAAKNSRPNILFCISDDQSYAHTGANGDPVIQTPAFDLVAREGLRFVHAFLRCPHLRPVA